MSMITVQMFRIRVKPIPTAMASVTRVIQTMTTMDSLIIILIIVLETVNSIGPVCKIWTILPLQQIGIMTVVKTILKIPMTITTKSSMSTTFALTLPMIHLDQPGFQIQPPTTSTAMDAETVMKTSMMMQMDLMMPMMIVQLLQELPQMVPLVALILMAMVGQTRPMIVQLRLVILLETAKMHVLTTMETVGRMLMTHSPTRSLSGQMPTRMDLEIIPKVSLLMLVLPFRERPRLTA